MTKKKTTTAGATGGVDPKLLKEVTAPTGPGSLPGTVVTDADIEKDAMPDVTLARRKINRGSTRRIVKAMNAFDKAFETFNAEINLQFFMVDDDDKRVGDCDMVKQLREARTGINHKLNEMLHPAAEA